VEWNARNVLLCLDDAMPVSYLHITCSMAPASNAIVRFVCVLIDGVLREMT
jgi:hypothetical protein